MICNKERKDKFRKQIILLCLKYSIKQVAIARNINKSRQHVSHVFNGKIIFASEQFNTMCKFLHEKGASIDELSLLKRLFVEVKSGIDLQKINLIVPVDPIKQVIMENLNYLSSSELVKIHKKIEIYKFNHLREADAKLAEN